MRDDPRPHRGDLPSLAQPALMHPSFAAVTHAGRQAVPRREPRRSCGARSSPGSSRPSIIGAVCFSAQASFVAAAVLTGIGAVSVRRAPTRRHVAFGAVPLIFAAQQAVEGALWLVLERSPYGKS